jgi:hypothetical protein
MGVVRPGEETQRDWGKYGLGSAVAGWLIACFPAVVPAAVVLWCLGLIWGIGSWRRKRSGYGLAGLIAASVGFAYVILGIALGLAFF